MTGFLNRSYFCQKCKKGYDHRECHVCNDPCIYCHYLHEEEEEDWKFCYVCRRHFKNGTCFDMHLKKQGEGKSTCQIYFKCKICDQTINMRKHKKEHQCGEKYCKTCKDFCAQDHHCYMQTVTQTNNKKQDTKYVYFDFECTQDSRLECEQGYLPDVNSKCVNCKKSSCGAFEHCANLCVAQKVCQECMYSEITSHSICRRCGQNEKIFKGRDAANLFCKWLFSEENVGATVIAHNFKSYDSYMILRYLHKNVILPEVITTGSKYMSITVPVCKMRFIDSINFMPMALADLPEAFGETELTKGYFPHLFNRQENQQVVLPQLPDVKYYNPDGMKPKSRQQFLQWYKEHMNDTFDFHYELTRYCKSDVDILRRCCLKFRALFMELTVKGGAKGIDPFAKCITIASACNLVFRTKFLDNETIAIIPPHGYRPEAKQSTMAYQWLFFEAHARNINIQHGKNIGEMEIGPYKVDGYYEKEGEKYVLEFNGCFWHGCPKCFSASTVNPVRDQTMGDLYLRTMEKKTFLEGRGFKYHDKWECEFKREIDKNAELKSFIDTLELVTPLEPRDAFYGGRTEAFKLYEEADINTQIKYYDVTSLYPFVNKTGKIPIGHPEIFTENFSCFDEYEGLIKCKILPPRGLYIPVLPMKCNGKLMFCLCRTCAENYQQTSCTHSDSDRSILGTWVTDEVKMALTQGYQIEKIYEVWHFAEVSQYDPVTKSGGIFTEYVNTFLKIKQEASGWPDWCTDEEKKRQYIQEYFEKEGIWLDYDKIKKNSGLRSLAKLMLNSFWGKFGQRSNLTKTSYISEPSEFFDMMTSDQQLVKNVRFVNSEAVQVDWNYNDEFIEASSRTNVIIAAYTTAQARLKLYSYLKELGTRTLYCDTDSVVFTCNPGEWQPPLGDFLGDLTDETPQNSITKFVTGGPKNYAFTLANSDRKGNTSVCKVRGITLNYKNALEINFDTIKEMVIGESNQSCVQVVDANKICRNKDSGHIITQTEYKDYKIVFDKRVIGCDLYSYPYGM